MFMDYVSTSRFITCIWTMNGQADTLHVHGLRKYQQVYYMHMDYEWTSRYIASAWTMNGPEDVLHAYGL